MNFKVFYSIHVNTNSIIIYIVNINIYTLWVRNALNTKLWLKTRKPPDKLKNILWLTFQNGLNTVCSYS